MQVYKIFFRILSKQKGQIIMYLCIFLGVASIISSQADDPVEGVFEGTDYVIAIFDEDRSEYSKSLATYLSTGYEVADIQDDKETIQDELYNRNISCVIRIPGGFGDSMVKGADIKKPELTTIPGTIYGETFKGMVNKYVSLTRSYVAGGFSAQEALKKAEETCGETVPVSMPKKSGGSTHSRLYYYFAYLPYIFLSICVVGIGPIMVVFHKKDVKERNACSAYSLTRTNFQLFAGVVTAGVGICLLYCLMVMTGTGMAIFSFQGFLHCLNMVCFMVVSLGFVFFLGQVVKKDHILSMISNVVSLGMCFLCGIFVPLELLGEGVIRAAHFLPAYWYITSADFIDRYIDGGALGELWMGLGIELLFGAALISVGLAYSKVKMENSAA